MTLRARKQEVTSSSPTAATRTSSTCWSRPRLEAALAAMDTDHDGSIDADEWCVSESATLGRLSTSPAHRSRSAQGGVHREGAREQARAARRGARGAEQGRTEGDRRVHGRVPFRRPALLRAHRQGRRRHAQRLAVWKSNSELVIDGVSRHRADAVPRGRRRVDGVGRPKFDFHRSAPAMRPPAARSCSGRSPCLSATAATTT